MFTSFPRFPAGGPRTDDDSIILFGTYTCEHRSQHATGQIEGRSLALCIAHMQTTFCSFLPTYQYLSYSKTFKVRPMGYFARKSGGLKSVIKVTGSFQGSNHDY